MDGMTGPALLAWFDEHKRDLPWRRTRDPYAIWVSEIMLQQTRVAAVLDHYARWMQRFPTVAALAEAEEGDVLALWSGLGYYRRARMLHRAAQVIVAEHGGALPATAAGLRALPGVGEYTSAAIASIAFSEEVAVVDGNVERVVTRLEGLALPDETATVGHDKALRVPTGTTMRKKNSEQAEKPTAASVAKAIRIGATGLLVAGRPGDSNQAMMELGATVCLPKGPLCLHCPVQPWCVTRGEHVATPRRALVAREVRYALVERAADGRILLQQRPSDVSLMAGMWELPELAPENAEGTRDSPVILHVKHAITVTNYAVSIVRVSEEEFAGLPIPAPQTARWIAVDELHTLALTGLARKVLKRLALWSAP